jgi:hypothetical protein
MDTQAAARHRHVDRMDNAAVARIHGAFRDFAGRDAGQDVLLVLFGIAGEQSGLPTMGSVQPGFTTSGDNPYMRKNGWLQMTTRALASNMHKPRHVIEAGGETANFGARARTGERASRDYDQRAGKSAIGVMARP